ncbi:Transcription factor bHLH25 [Spatholobus suberectus]|nr:Transcription factor bHLH25 [Spatholobus suberectus]
MTTAEESWTSWLCDLQPEDYNNFVNQSDSNGVDGSFPARDDTVPPPQENLQGSFSRNGEDSSSIFQTEHSSTMSNSSGDDKIFGESPAKTLNTGTSNSANISYLSQMEDSSLSYILAFDNVNPAPILYNDSTLKPKAKVACHGRKGPLENQKKEPRHNIQENNNSGSASRSPHHAKDHIITERKRREKISQQFIALSALIPGLKKMDKASVLGDAIKHVKQLQEQVKLQEEQNKRKRVESVVYVEKSKFSSDEDVSDTSSNSGDGNSYDPSKTNVSLPEVEARVLEKHVLIRIHCKKQKGLFMNALKVVENLHLSVINSSMLLFGTSKLDITIVAEMDDEFSLSVKELARNLRVGLVQFM